MSELTTFSSDRLDELNKTVYSSAADVSDVSIAVIRIRNVRFIGTLFLRVEVSCNEGNVVFAKITLFIPKSKSFVTFLRIFPILGFFRGGLGEGT